MITIQPSEHVGPSLWHGREVNSCTRCKYLKCRLVKSGRHPDYEYFCLHPTSLAPHSTNPDDSTLLAKIKAQFPERLSSFIDSIQRRNDEMAQKGEFIANDCMTPETPYWCPVIKSNTQLV